jgi:hypothetical protein
MDGFGYIIAACKAGSPKGRDSIAGKFFDQTVFCDDQVS